jgi:hypothetical protein
MFLLIGSFVNSKPRCLSQFIQFVVYSECAAGNAVHHNKACPTCFPSDDRDQKCDPTGHIPRFNFTFPRMLGFEFGATIFDRFV